jgi:hypothetical protein
MQNDHRAPGRLAPRHIVHSLALNAAWAALLVAISDGIGTLGYHWFAGFRWIDSFLNASMLLGGMGPIGDLPNDGAKLFASVFALYSGLVFLVVAGLMLAPMFHRVLHRFHWEDK